MEAHSLKRDNVTLKTFTQLMEAGKVVLPKNTWYVKRQRNKASLSVLQFLAVSFSRFLLKLSTVSTAPAIDQVLKANLFFGLVCWSHSQCCIEGKIPHSPSSTSSWSTCLVHGVRRNVESWANQIHKSPPFILSEGFNWGCIDRFSESQTSLMMCVSHRMILSPGI